MALHITKPVSMLVLFTWTLCVFIWMWRLFPDHSKSIKRTTLLHPAELRFSIQEYTSAHQIAADAYVERTVPPQKTLADLKSHHQYMDSVQVSGTITENQLLMAGRSSDRLTRLAAAGSDDRISRNSSTQLCDGKRIYVYDLPIQFNYQILQQCDRNITDWLNFCPYMENDGFGQALENEKGWYGTDFYMLEVIFHSRMKEYPCLTSNYEEADAVFIPYYSGLDALRYLYGKDVKRRNKQGLELVSWLEKEGGEGWKRWGGLDHFMVMGRTSWDFCSDISQANPTWGTSLREQPALANVTALFIESRPWQQNEQAVPYPTSFHPASEQDLQEWLERVRVASKRPILFTFIGAPRGGAEGSIRQAVLEECLQLAANSSKEKGGLCSVLDCREVRCAHNPVPIRERLLQSDFCLQPPGDSPTRRSAFDGLIAGCIPIFFHKDSFYTQYTWHIPPHHPHSDYSVFIHPQDLLHRGLKVHHVLRNYTRHQISHMRHRILSLIPSLIYTPSSASSQLRNAGLKDAFDLSLEGFLRKAALLKSTSLNQATQVS